MAEIKLAAESRNEFGKGAARRLRRESKIPAVLYAHGLAPQHVALPAHQTTLALRQTNALFEVDVEGKVQLAVVKDVQRDPVRQIVEHIDLLIVKAGEKITVEVPVDVWGSSAPGTQHNLESLTLEIRAEATRLPSSLRIDITGLTEGTVLLAKDVMLKEGLEMVTPGDHDVLTITAIHATDAEPSTDDAE